MKALKKATTKRLIKELSKRGAVYGIIVDDQMAMNGSGCCLLTLLCNVAASMVEDLPEGSDVEEILSRFVEEIAATFKESTAASDGDELDDNSD